MKPLLSAIFILAFVTTFLLSANYETQAYTASYPFEPVHAQMDTYASSSTYNVVAGGMPCKATYYGDYFHGRLTANGEVFDEEGMTAASTTYPIGTVIVMQYGDKSVQVRINDTGAFSHTVDLSKGAFRKLAPLEQGVIDGRCTIL